MKACTVPTSICLFWTFALGVCALASSTIRAQESPASDRANAVYARDLLREFDRMQAGRRSPANLPVPNAEPELARARSELERQPAALEEALRWTERAAEKNDPAAQYLMGRVKENELPFAGQVAVRGDVVAAAEWYKKAAVQNVVPAMYRLGEFYAYGSLETYDIEGAVHWWELAAKGGSVKAMRDLGWLYQLYTPETGTRLAPQYELALQWYRRAAEKGDSEAMYQVARHYHFGWGTEKNEAESKRWLARALDAGHDQAALVLRGTVTFEPGPGQTNVTRQTKPLANASQISEDQLMMSGNHGNAEASLLLAKKYEFGLGVSRNLQKALDEYRPMASVQDRYRPRWISVEASEAIVRILASEEFKPDVQVVDIGINDPEQIPSAAVRFQLAEMYWRGNPAVKPDPRKAVSWYLNAARAGSAPAMRRLGELWRDGVNGQPDPAEAERWFRRAEALESTATTD